MKKISLIRMMALVILVPFCFTACEEDSDDDLNNNPPPVPQPEGLTDSRDGNTYKTVEIANQVWMAENLAYLPSVSTRLEQSHKDPHYYVYDYEGDDVNAARNTQMYASYGALYNWTAAQTACPPGWHLPSDQEWKQLEMAIGMSQAEADKTSWRSTSGEGAKLKSASGWNDNGNGTDDYGFSAKPSGYLTSSFAFIQHGNNTNFWTSSEHPDVDFGGWYRNLVKENSSINRGTMYKQFGFCVRCVKD
jgi:uncharacterized protein (TIGR02145 family)